MKIEHIAIWVKDLECIKDFYEQYFDAVSGEKYVNRTKNFSSYFLSFESGARLELMHKPEIVQTANQPLLGWAHIAFSVGSKEKVIALTAQLQKDGYRVQGQPRRTGDGYFESVVLDPEGNQIEITV